MEVYGSVDWDAGAMAINGVKLSGLELSCRIGSVVVRDVALFDLGEYVLTTERFGSKVMEVDDALEEGYGFYPDYWEMLSIATAGDACCGRSYSFLANIYFGKASTSLFDWAMLYVEASVPLSAQVDVAVGIEAKPSGTDYVAIGLELDW